jgi:hypothetical protein
VVHLVAHPHLEDGQQFGIQAAFQPMGAECPRRNADRRRQCAEGKKEPPIGRIPIPIRVMSSQRSCVLSFSPRPP